MLTSVTYRWVTQNEKRLMPPSLQMRNQLAFPPPPPNTHSAPVWWTREREKRFCQMRQREPGLGVGRAAALKQTFIGKVKWKQQKSSWTRSFKKHKWVGRKVRAVVQRNQNAQLLQPKAAGPAPLANAKLGGRARQQEPSFPSAPGLSGPKSPNSAVPERNARTVTVTKPKEREEQRKQAD